MAWKDNSAHIRPRRVYRCDECAHVFQHRPETEDEAPPPCPACVQAGQPAGQPVFIPPMPALNTTKSKAVDLAQKMAEEDFGLTNFNDNQRVGDIAIMPEKPMHGAEADAKIREMLAWQAAQDAQQAMPLPHEPILANGDRAKVAAENRNVLVDPARQVQDYWQGVHGGSAETTIGQSEAARAASVAAKNDGVDPIGILERGRASGSMPMRLNVMGSENNIPAALAEAQAKRGAVP